MAEEIKEEKQGALKSGKVTKILNNISILGLFAVAGLITLMLTGAIVSNRGLIVALAIFGFVCLGSILLTPWVRNLERKKNVTLSWVFTAFVIVCVVLWIVGTFVVNALINKINNGTATDGFALGTMNFVRITLVISLQFVVANFVARNVLRYGKRMIIFQAIAYASYLYMDAWLSMALCCFNVSKTGGFSTNQAVTSFIFSRLGWTLFALALVWIIVANTIVNNTNKNGELRRQDGRRRRGLGNRIIGRMVDREERSEEDEYIDNAEKANSGSADDTRDKLIQLKEMFDKGLITKEEYDEKRSKLIDQL